MLAGVGLRVYGRAVAALYLAPPVRARLGDSVSALPVSSPPGRARGVGRAVGGHR